MMGTTKQQIAQWFARGQSRGSRYMVVVCDTFDFSDYPVYCGGVESARKTIDHPGEMQRAMECYDLEVDMVDQLEMRRCWALPQYVARAEANPQEGE
jgi:hypothetical protein